MTYRNTTFPQTAFPKPVRQTDEDYLDYIRSLPCIVCGASPPSDPNHIQTVGAGGSDYGTLPMCRRCHDEFHRTFLYEFEAKHQINCWREVALLLMVRLGELQAAREIEEATR